MTVLQAYYQYLQDKANVKALEEDLRDAITNLDAAEQLNHIGINTKVDVLLARSQLANTKMKLENFKIALAALATSMGLPANTLFDVPDLPETLPVQEIAKELDTLMCNAMQQRADLSAYAVFTQQKANLREAE